jgi:AbrB family looped-hinge helix DNA binding protein
MPEGDSERDTREPTGVATLTTTVSSKGQIVLPAKIRQQVRIEGGQEFEIERIEQGEYLLKRKTRRPNEAL